MLRSRHTGLVPIIAVVKRDCSRQHSTEDGRFLLFLLFLLLLLLLLLLFLLLLLIIMLLVVDVAEILLVLLLLLTWSPWRLRSQQKALAILVLALAHSSGHAYQCRLSRRL